MIVVVSYSDDPHAALVEKALEEEGFTDFFRLDFEQSFATTHFAIRHDAWQVVSPQLGLLLARDSATTVWWRRTGKLPTPTGECSSTELEQTEAYWAVRWLIESLPQTCFPFGHPANLRAAENKLRQLQVAQAVGFRVPATCLSNNKDTLRAFCKEYAWVVVKPLYATITRDEAGRELSLYASTVERDRLAEMLQEASAGVCLMCQERIWKQRDVRALFFPDGRHFACEIDSSTLPPSEVDWRPHTMSYAHTVIRLTDSIRSQGEKYLSALGLTSGSFDFAVTDAGEWVFLECNPNAQWLWMELKTGYELARQVATVLLAHQRDSLGHNQGNRS